MSDALDLQRLADLHSAGKLTDDEFAQAKARVLSGKAAASPQPAPAITTTVNRLRRSQRERWLGGVCGGLAQWSGLEAWGWRILFTLAVLFGGTGIAAYLLLWIFVPAEAEPGYTVG